MRKAVLLSALVIAAAQGGLPAAAQGLTEAEQRQVYDSCVAAGRQNASVSADAVERYCTCFRREAARRFTSTAMAELEARGRAGASTAEDRAAVQGMIETCGPELRR